jgi:hypothetical protein
MKTNRQCIGLVSLAIAITALLLNGSAYAVTHDIVMTENSSASLTVTFDATDITATGVNNTGPDQWTVTFPLVGDFFESVPPFFLSWNEPGSTTVINNVTPVSSSTKMLVMSDVSESAFTHAPDDTTLFAHTFVNDYHITFDDDGDAPIRSVPDTGSTLGLLFLSLMALFGINRFRACRLA